MKKNITSFAGKAISVIAACALSMSMLPATALAAIQDQTSNDTSQDAAQVEDASQDAASVDTQNSAPDVISEVVDVNSSASSSASQTANVEQSGDSSSSDNAGTLGKAEDADVEVVSAQVSLANDETATVINHNGLTYTVNTDDPTTLALVGWSGNVPVGNIQIPAQIVQGSATYTVTKLSGKKTLGGGTLF